MKSFIKHAAIFLLLAIQIQLSAESAICANNDAVWKSLQKGNKAFVKNPEFARQRAKLVNGQNPPCVVLSCSDSRVPPELVFDQGLGRLFVARVAGNVVDDIVVDSIEFAVSTWDVSDVVILGHTDCGAVIGALRRLQKNHGVIDPSIGHLNAVLIPIEKAIVAAGIDIYGPDALKQSTRANIQYSAEQLLLQSPAIAKAVARGEVIIRGAEYSMKTGKVKQLFVIDSSSSSF